MQMPKLSQSEQFDRIVTALLASPAALPPNSGKQLSDVAAIAGELRALPREDFRATLKAQLEGGKPMASQAPAVTAPKATHTATAFLIFKGAARAIDFYKEAFGATEVMRLNMPGDRIGYAEIRIGGASIMLADESPDLGAISAETLGGSPVSIHLSVPDVDAVAERFVAAGGRVFRAVQDQFYGERSGQLIDPFGYKWLVATPKEEVTAEEMQKRFNKLTSTAAPTAEEEKWKLPIPYLRKGFHTLTPYLLTTGAAKLIEFFKAGFGAEESFRVPRSGTSDDIMHAQLRVGDSMLELSDATPEFPARKVMHSLFVDDVDASYRRALQAGGVSLSEPAEQFYGDREAGIADPSGNYWYLTERRATGHMTPDTRTIMPGFSGRDAAGFVEFMKVAFHAQEAFMHKSPEGEVIHGRIRIGDSIIAVGELRGDFPLMPFHLHMYVPDTDAVYARALSAGAKMMRAPKDEPYGDRAASVEDAYGNMWSIATHIKDVKF
jgi:PhnB protein